MELLEKSIQFLVCPQKDFMDRIASDAEKPNQLHIGYEGALRLRGTGVGSDPFVETVSRFFDPRIPGSEKVSVVIDEDWHPESCEEFPIFGRHCVKGTSGAQLAGDLEEYRWSPKTHILRANSINPVADKRYYKVLEEIRGKTKTEWIRVGVMGVWTHIKVEYLLISLRTLPPYFKHIGVCEPLCTSPNLEDHQRAIKKFGVLGFQVFYDIEEYCQWMGLEVNKSYATSAVS
jgi:nicotinamidase-related amidase